MAQREATKKDTASQASHTQYAIYWKVVLPIAAVLFAIFAMKKDGTSKQTIDIEHKNPIPSVHEHSRTISPSYLQTFVRVYGGYGLERPDFIPSSADIDTLKRQLEADTPIITYYNILEPVVAPPGIEDVWNSVVLGRPYDEIPDYTEAVHTSIIGSVLIENEDDFTGQRSAFLEAFGTLQNTDSITVLNIRKVHAALYISTPPPDPNNIPGNIRSVHAFIGNDLTAHIFEIESALTILSHQFNTECAPLPTKSLDFAVCAMRFYHSYERIHPFTDGNGRTGRAWLNAMLLWKELPPLHFKSEWLDNPVLYHDLFLGGQVDEKFLREHLEAVMRNVRG
ncbi:hypothetical protein TWF281_005069 [Arthrobotrys megalospora]